MRDAARILIARFARHRGGGVAVGFGVMLLGTVGALGVAIDYIDASGERTRLQSIADAAALAAAREFRLGNASESVIKQSVVNHARGALGDRLVVTITPSADMTAKSVTAFLSATVPTRIAHVIGAFPTAIAVTATAKMTGGAPVCVVGLEENANATIEMDKSARLQAPNCAVYSNSRKPNGLVARNSAVMQAAFICSAGGKDSPGPGAFQPSPRTDCPPLPDPLAKRPLPVAGGCSATNLEVKGAMVSLNPGTYCGGLKISANARVTLFAGVYIFKDGPLVVTGGSTLNGDNAGLHFVGPNAALNFDSASSVSLTAPKTGDMAGLLITEDRANAPTQFNIASNDARTLLGTIYLPVSRLHIAAQSPVGDRSAYTIVVARRFTLSEGPTMVLNTNYGATDIPVPAGVGPGGATSLSH